MRPKISGEPAYRMAYGVLSAVRTRGVLFTITYYLASWAMDGIGYAWKARLVLHWRMSPLIDYKELDVRERTCDACDQIKVVPKGKQEIGVLRFCGSCGCKDWKWSELSTKNSRKGHYCPLGEHPGSELPEALKVPGGGCKGCGNGRTGSTLGNNSNRRNLQSQGISHETSLAEI